MFRFILFFITLIVANTLSAQIQPIEGSKLNYRLIGFSVPFNAKINSYRLDIAEGIYNKDKEFEEKIIIKDSSDDNKKIIIVPYFGHDYTWRMTSLSGKNKKKKSKLYHFSTIYSACIDTSKNRVRVIDSAIAHKDMFVFLDYYPIIYDMKGNPLWYLPEIPGVIEHGKRLRDFKPTNTGTFTVMNDNGAFEFDYNGRLLWKAPNDGKISGDTTEYYHHDFTKLSSGSYMVEGQQRILRPMPASFNKDLINPNDETIIKKDEQYYKRIECGTLIEYDAAGKIVWSWKSSSYFTDDDYFTKTFPDGTYNTSTHLNSFYFDENTNIIYLSFRDISKVLKIKYPDGQVVRWYGKPDNPERNRIKKVNFKSQHNVSLNKDRNLMLFNNNTERTREAISELAIFKEPAGADESLVKIWQFPCNIDTNAASGAASGGSISMLEDSCILGCMGIEGRVFLVSYDKKLLWNAIPEYKDEAGNWVLQPEYRAALIEKREYLRKFVFHKQ